MNTIQNTISRHIFALFVLALLAVTACTSDPGRITLRTEKMAVEEWRDQRLQNLLRDDGWLTVVGLHWLRGGQNTFGSDARMDIVFPKDKTPKFAGLIYIEGKITAFEAAEGVNITHNGKAVQRMRLETDGGGDPTILQMGSLSFYVIERNGRRAIRLKDSESTALKEFSGIEHFPISLKWRVQAYFTPSDSGNQMDIPTILGTTTRSTTAGTLEFEMNGEKHHLIALGEPGEKDLFLIFGDETNGNETYHGGRFLTATVGDDGETAIIDFNMAYNPPCVFTDYATCPLPPQENRLALRIEAGEKVYGEHH
ncbi:DUF1684 domain-containing protein [Candidatus Neomarinimicrobiota bacterium]